MTPSSEVLKRNKNLKSYDMRWKNKHPNDGEEREARFFAWVPVHCQDEFRWLEKVVILQSYWYGQWVNREFLN